MRRVSQAAGCGREESDPRPAVTREVCHGIQKEFNTVDRGRACGPCHRVDEPAVAGLRAFFHAKLFPDDGMARKIAFDPPADQLFHALDRPIIIAVGTDAQWVACATALGLEDLAADSPLSTNAGRLAGRDRIVDALSRRVAERSAHEWIAVLQKNGVPCGLVKSVLEALSEVDASPLTGIAPSVPGVVRLPPPKLDEHGDAIRRHGWRVFEGPDR